MNWNRRTYGLTVREETSASGYTHVYLRWFSGELESLSDRIAGCIDNRAGYCSQEIADRVALEARKALDEGIKHTFQSDITYGVSITIRCQLYSEATESEPRRWCQPRVEANGSDTFGEVIRNSKALVRLQRELRQLQRDTCEDPSPELIAKALRRMAPTHDIGEWRDGGILPVLSYPAKRRKRAAAAAE